MRAALIAVLNRWPRVKELLKHVLNSMGLRRGTSSPYTLLTKVTRDRVASQLKSAWKMDELPKRQRAIADAELASYRAGEAVNVFDTLVQALNDLPISVDEMTVLEVGCSSGYYSEVIAIAGLDVRYTGCDFSNAFVDLARQYYPCIQFDTEDATSLSYSSASFDIVISGCCLLHIAEYERAVLETARVASKFAIFHRTPVVWGQPEQTYRKKAYGVDMLEIHFNEPDFLALLHRNGLILLATYTLVEEVSRAKPAQGSAIRTYVCKKGEQ